MGLERKPRWLAVAARGTLCLASRRAVEVSSAREQGREVTQPALEPVTIPAS
jgi:hypothetical protein